VRARLARCLAAVAPEQVQALAGHAAVAQVAAGINVRDAEELEVANIVSKGTSVLLGPLVRCVRVVLLVPSTQSWDMARAVALPGAGCCGVQEEEGSICLCAAM
jgi:hypothetical protein